MQQPLIVAASVLLQYSSAATADWQTLQNKTAAAPSEGAAAVIVFLMQLTRQRVHTWRCAL